VWFHDRSCAELSNGLVKSVSVGLLVPADKMPSVASGGNDGGPAIGDAGSVHGN